MANGRFLSKTIAVSLQLASVSDQAEMLFYRMIPHLDSDGRMEGEPRLVKAIAAPLKESLTVERITALLHELVGAKDSDGEGLLQWYTAKGKLVLQFPGFCRHQGGLRKDREAPSRLPPFDGAATAVPAPESPPRRRRSTTGTGPEPDQSRSGLTPAEVPPKLREVEVEVEGKVKGTAHAVNGTAKGGWPARFADHLKPIGLFDVGRVGKALGPMVKEYGVDRAEEMTIAYGHFAAHMDRNGQVDPAVNTPQYCSPEKLAQTAGFWYEYTQPLPIPQEASA